MKYEQLYQQYQENEIALKDASAKVAKLQKAIMKNLEVGDLKQYKANSAAFLAALEEAKNIASLIEENINQFDTNEYFESGEFSQELLSAAQDMNIDLSGTFPNFESFPFKIRIESENSDIYLDKKKYSTIRPKAFLDIVKAGHEKLNKESFNETNFATELSQIYDLALLKLNKKPGSEINLSVLYKFVVPMSRFKKEYNLQSYAFDLARLFMKDPVTLKDGRSYKFGTSHQMPKNGIRITDNLGNELFLFSISFANTSF